jgi:hypothetical protein
LVAEEIRQNHTVMKTKSAIDQVKEFTPRTLKEIVHGRAKTLRPLASLKSEWLALSHPRATSDKQRVMFPAGFKVSSSHNRNEDAPVKQSRRRLGSRSPRT